MKKTILSLVTLLGVALTSNAITDNTVEVVYDGASATVTVADNISSYITSSVSGANVRIVQSESVGSATGEILYYLSGSSDNGSFYMEGSYKATVVLNGVTLNNTAGPAIDVQNGKRIKFSLASGTTNTLSDGAGGDWKGCLVCKGHSEFKGKGTLNVTGNSAHGIWSKEYVELKNSTVNILSAVKDAINCNQFFLMTSGTLNISAAGDDAIQVSLEDEVNTGVTVDHEDEDSGNFYQEDGTITIATITTGYCIKTDGTISFNGGSRTFDTSNVLENAATGIQAVNAAKAGTAAVYDLQGHQLSAGKQKKGVYIIKKENGDTQKVLVK